MRDHKPSRLYIKKKSKAVSGLSGPYKELEPFEEVITELAPGHTVPEPQQVQEPLKANSQQPTANSQKPKAGIISSRDLKEMQFVPLKVTGIWADLLGRPCEPLYMMLFGMPGSGKSSMAILFAKYLVKELLKKVLYIANEEGFNHTLKDKFERINAWDDNLHIATEIPANIMDYDFIFFDSVNNLKLSVEDVAELIIKSKKKGVSLILIYQATKQGLYRGMSENEHLVDCSFKIDGGKTATQKNRFGGTGIINIFEHIKE